MTHQNRLGADFGVKFVKFQHKLCEKFQHEIVTNLVLKLVTILVQKFLTKFSAEIYYQHHYDWMTQQNRLAAKVISA